MSSHYIYVSCPVPDCSAFASLYTGDEVLEGFENDQWEQEFIYVPCDEHEGWTKPEDTPAPEPDAEAVERVREALAGHPTCEKHPEDDSVSCGWKRAVLDVQAALTPRNE